MIKKNQIRSLECFTHFNQIIDYPFQLYRRVKKKLNDDDLKTNLAYILHVLFYEIVKNGVSIKALVYLDACLYGAYTEKGFAVPSILFYGPTSGLPLTET